MGYFRMLAAIPGFFLSSLFLMLLWDWVAPKLGLSVDMDYVLAMMVTIVIWVTVAPLAAVGRKH